MSVWPKPVGNAVDNSRGKVQNVVTDSWELLQRNWLTAILGLKSLAATACGLWCLIAYNVETLQHKE